MIKIRLAKTGRVKRPIFTIVAIPSRNARDGKFIARLGKYDPQATNTQLTGVKVKDIAEFIKNGAVISDTVRTILKRNKITLPA